MKKIILASFVVALMIVTVVGACFTAGAVVVPSQRAQFQSIEMAGKGTVKGTITNQNGRPIPFVRVIAAGNPRDNATELGFTLTHLLFGGKGRYSMKVPAGRYVFVRAARLPVYRGAWAGPVVVTEGESITLDLSITYVGPKNMPVVFPRFQVLDYEKLLYWIYSIIIPH
jgi:hypothetical protein